MNAAFRLKLAKQKAEAFLQAEGMTTLPVDPFAIAANRDIVVEPKPDAEDGVSGMLLHHNTSFCILYATHIQNEGFQRFSVSHELGHYFLDGHLDHVLKDGVHSSQAGFVSADPYELEAAYFAAGLLMPSTPLMAIIGRRDPGLAVIEAMSAVCRTSLTATAIRYAELTRDAVAVIISTGTKTDFCFLSEAMKKLPELTWLRKGFPVPKDTETAVFNANPERVLRGDRAEEEIDVLDWLGGKRSVMVTEEVVGLGRYGKTLTVLSSSSIDDDHDDDDGDSDDDDVVERWKPRF